jgi:hypothetical protein
MLFVVIKLVSCFIMLGLTVGTLTLNHMTITKIYTLEGEDIIEVDKSIDYISSLPTESAIKRVLRIGIHHQFH